MKSKITLIAISIALLSSAVSLAQEIQVENLTTTLPANTKEYSKTILENEIDGITITQFSITGDVTKKELQDENYRDIYLFVKGNGKLIANKKNFDIVPETVLVQNAIKTIALKAEKNDTLHFLKISSILTKQDKLDLLEFPKENTQEIYFKKFTDCQAYTEPIKSPNTVSRTIFPNKYIPRIAMGTVQATGPDKVAPHEHGMLEQLFLGLAGNNIVVYADEAQTNLPAYSLLHIPLGSSHSVKVDEGKEMYYIWMDFFLDKKGEEWLKTHNAITKP
ncbi:cupin domain-containing protein [uncultured Arcticibacterium sp.]|uniref:cupin domain-containing protein n=1 Tax=uncultured Arcticibacterium sp. TaxID=2173042 RepID=UPI0030F75C47